MNELLAGFYDRTIEKLRQKGMSETQFCKSIDIRRGFLSDIHCGIKNDIYLSMAVKISEALNYSLDYLVLGKNNCSLDISENEEKLLLAWRLASDDERENVAFILRKYGVEAETQKEAQKVG